MTAHRAICRTLDCEEHYACRLRNKGLNVSPTVFTSRTQNWRPSVSVPDSSRAEIIYDERPGGIKSPLLKEDGSQLRRYDLIENPGKYEGLLRQVKNLPNQATPTTP